MYFGNSGGESSDSLLLESKGNFLFVTCPDVKGIPAFIFGGLIAW
jgi:hypothetical protein